MKFQTKLTDSSSYLKFAWFHLVDSKRWIEKYSMRNIMKTNNSASLTLLYSRRRSNVLYHLASIDCCEALWGKTIFAWFEASVCVKGASISRQLFFFVARVMLLLLYSSRWTINFFLVRRCHFYLSSTSRTLSSSHLWPYHKHHKQNRQHTIEPILIASYHAHFASSSALLLFALSKSFGD